MSVVSAAVSAIAHLDKKATPKKGKKPCNSERGWVGMKPGCKRAKKGTAQRVRGVQRVRQGKSRRPAKATVIKGLRSPNSLRTPKAPDPNKISAFTGARYSEDTIKAHLRKYQGKKANAKPGKVLVSVSGPNGKREKSVDGLITGDIALVKNKDIVAGGKGYSVTHIPTGLNIGNIGNKSVGVAVSAALNDSGLDWKGNPVGHTFDEKAAITTFVNTAGKPGFSLKAKKPKAASKPATPVQLSPQQQTQKNVFQQRMAKHYYSHPSMYARGITKVDKAHAAGKSVSLSLSDESSYGAKVNATIDGNLIPLTKKKLRAKDLKFYFGLDWAAPKASKPQAQSNSWAGTNAPPQAKQQPSTFKGVSIDSADAPRLAVNAIARLAG